MPIQPHQWLPNTARPSTRPTTPQAAIDPSCHRRGVHRGAFTALYGSGRPHLNRAGYLAVIAAAFAAAVGLGAWAKSIPWLAVPAVTLIATTAAFVCNALRVGPPGAYMFALACAAGTAMPSDHFRPWQTGLLVIRIASKPLIAA